MKKEKIRLLKNFLLVICGTLVLSLGTAVFIVPFDLVVGGVSGFAIVISRALGGALSADMLITLLAWSLFFLGLLVLGKDFALKTLVSTALYPVGVSLFSGFVGSGAFGGFFDFELN